MSNNEVFSLGRYTNFEWTVTQFSPLEFEIHYEGGDAFKGTNRFVCIYCLYIHMRLGMCVCANESERC